MRRNFKKWRKRRQKRWRYVMWAEDETIWAMQETAWIEFFSRYTMTGRISSRGPNLQPGPYKHKITCDEVRTCPACDALRSCGQSGAGASSAGSPQPE